MKPVRLCAVLAAVVVLRAQQPPAAPSPEQQLEQKLAQPFLKKADWTTDWDAARARAATARKLILGYFTTAGP